MTDSTGLVRATLPSSIRTERGKGGLPRVSVRSDLATAEVYFQGAHLTAWQPAAAKAPVLWMSRHGMFEPGKPIRGGVPICFPWFGPQPAAAGAPPHGFARLRDWTLVLAREEPTGTIRLDFELAGRRLSPAWPHGFRLTHRLTFGPVLRMELEVHNPGPESFTFEEALHTYFGVGDIHTASVTGLENTDHIDKVAGGSRGRHPNEPVRFTAETDRIYLQTHAACVIHDPARRRQITVSKTGSDATVVWNPWIDKSRAMPDFGDDEWPGMLCVETCNVNVHARTLAPGETHRMAALVEVHDDED